ncbi:hypothetical protein NKOR_06270 [Candidatus Nitrosopumilus koreensis AR1]|uniref:Uncharacterized protein n=2 Tax=Nitrosopumilaceae TaxID=338190 RepID=K0B839_9ARCH|nr:hypothetical protein NKOR_06270 [Candidatus Nitrosopumilus koreensis AR1]
MQIKIMEIKGMYMLKTSEFTEEKIQESLKMLYADRQNEFRTISEVFLGKDRLNQTPEWKEFVLNFCLDVEDSFKTWSNQKQPSTTSPQKALTILRQIGNGMTSMNQLTHILNLAFNISKEFKEIYRRLK